MTNTQCAWIENGRSGTPQPNSELASLRDEREKFRDGLVRLTTSDHGTEIKWSVLSPCNASLFAAIFALDFAKGPFVLRFYVSGWFEEFHNDNKSAKQRIEEIIARGDRHFTCSTVVKDFEFNGAPLSPLFENCVRDQDGAKDYAVECVFENFTQQFHVEKIGTKSAINRVYGSFLSSFPCQSSSSYSQTVSKAYTEVLENGQPRYDQILAAMRMPNNDIRWVPYCRLVMPYKKPHHKPAVLVVSEISQVQIQLI